jgi:radical SAM protein with 4Fe4S-binding SPASM domain
MKQSAVDGYYRLARTTAVRHAHNQFHRWQHRRRYGVDSVSMFRNVEMEINSMCNRTCSYCPNVSHQRPSGYMDESLFQKIIAELAEMNFDGKVSYHFYGEPMLDKRLLDLVEYTAVHVPSCRPVIYSNGDFLTLDLFRQFVQRGRAQFFITQHDNFIPLHLFQILHSATDDEKRHISISFGKDICVTNRSGLVPARQILNLPLSAPCDWPLETIVITMKGNVVPCCNDYFETEVVGNVENHSLREIWCNKRSQRFRSALSHGDRSASKLCLQCDYVPTPSNQLQIVPQ